jgi:hypothetical protein
MFDVFDCLLEPLLEVAGEWLLLRFCDLLIWTWHGLESFLWALF